jgi:hypothetical protein
MTRAGSGVVTDQAEVRTGVVFRSEGFDYPRGIQAGNQKRDCPKSVQPSRTTASRREKIQNEDELAFVSFGVFRGQILVLIVESS